MTSDFALYDWQQEDVDKVAPIRNRLLAHEMGLGKTFIAGALDMENVTSTTGNTLWIGPLGTLNGVAEKLTQMGHDAPLIRIDPKDRNGTWRRFRNANGAVFLMHWEALRLMVDELKEIIFDHTVADECHRAQNRKAQQTRALKKIRTERKTAMSGTPTTGAPHKFWSILNWMYPSEFSSYWKFYNHFVNYEIQYPQGYHKITGPKNVDELRAMIDPYYVRHLKQEQCCPHHPNGVWDGPGKYYTTEWVELLPAQRKAYKDMARDMVAWVGEHEDSPLVASVAVAQMMRLQQFAVAYAQVGSGNQIYLSEPSAKLDRVMELLADNPDEPVVIWSQFKQLIYLLEERCKKAKVSILLYTGDNRRMINGVEERDRNVHTFAGGGAQVFAGTISAGGVGVDGLQYASSTMMFMDRLWNEALNKQAEDRLWRDGQKNAVQIIDIMARDTVDLGRKQRLEMTWGWIKTLLDNPSAVQRLLEFA